MKWRCASRPRRFAAAVALLLLAGSDPAPAQVPSPSRTGSPIPPGLVATNATPPVVGQPIGPIQPIQPLQPRSLTAPPSVTARSSDLSNLPPPPPDPRRQPAPGAPPTTRDQVRQSFDLPIPGYRPPAIVAIITEQTNVAAVTASATDGPPVYYVDPGGADDHSGRHGQPWQTLQKAADTVKAGATVIVNPGTYDGFDLRAKGTAQAPIIFRAATLGSVVIKAPNKKTPDDINLEGASFAVIDGFIVQNAGRAGIRVVEAEGVLIQNNVVGPNERWGIFTGFAPGVRILNNKTFGSRIEHGIYVSNSRGPADRPVITGNECYQNGQNGIQLNGDCTIGGDGVLDEALLDGNIVHDNGWKGLSLISMQRSVVQNNLIYGNGRAGIGAGGIHLTDEGECGKPSSENLVVNNTVIEPRIAALRITDGAQRNVLFNNIFLSRTPLAIEVTGNHVDPESNLLGGTGLGIFVDSGTGDFRLAVNSAARGRGAAAYGGRQAPAQDLAGHWRTRSAPSLGAFE